MYIVEMRFGNPAPLTLLKAFPTEKASKKINTIQEVASQNSFFYFRKLIPCAWSQHFLSAGTATNDINETHAILKREKENKTGKTDNFKRKLFPVVCLNIVINQEIKWEKDLFNCGF